MSDRLIPDSECKQGKCAMTITGCIGECWLKREQFPPMVLGDVTALQTELTIARQQAEELRKLLEESKVPEGWQLVPKEPTAE